MTSAMFLDFSYYFLINALSIIWFYCVGWLVLKLLKINFSLIQYGALVNLLIGTTINVGVFAICKTHFGTFQLIMFGLLILMAYEYKKHKISVQTSIKFIDHLKKIGELLVVVLLFLVLKIEQTAQFDIYPFSHPARDELFYSQVSSFMSRYGVETFYIDWVNEPGVLGLVPYHYFEIWLNAFITDSTGLLSINAYSFVVFVFVTLLLYQAILLLIEEITRERLNWKHKLVAVSLIYLGDIFFGTALSKILPGMASVGVYLYSNLKITLSFIVVLLAWREWKYGRYVLSMLLLLIIPLLNYGLMPVTLVSVPAFLLLHYWFMKSLEPIPYKKILLYYFVFFVALIGIQKIFKNNFDGITALGLNSLIDYYDSFDKVKTVINYIFNYFRKIVVLCIPFLFLIIPLRKYKLIHLKSGFAALLSIMLITALGLSAVLHFIIDTSQIFTITLNIISHILLYIALVLLLFKVPKNYFFKGVVVLYLISGGYIILRSCIEKGSRISYYSKEFLSSLKTANDSIKGQGIRYLTPDYYTSGAYDINPNCNFEGNYFCLLRNNVLIHTVTVNEIPDRKELHDFFNYNKKLILKSSFYLHFAQQMYPQTSNSDSIQLAFVKKYNIDFIIATKNAVIPKIISNLVSSEIKDRQTGERLLLIDRKRLTTDMGSN